MRWARKVSDAPCRVWGLLNTRRPYAASSGGFQKSRSQISVAAARLGRTYHLVARASAWSTTGQGRCTLTGLRHSNRHRVFPACSRLLALASCALRRATTGPRSGTERAPRRRLVRVVCAPAAALLWKDCHGAGGQRLAHARPRPRSLPANRGQRVKETLNTILLRPCSVTLTWRKRKALPTMRSAVVSGQNGRPSSESPEGTTGPDGR